MMNIIQLDSLIEKDQNVHLSIIHETSNASKEKRSKIFPVREHGHDFYELFILIKGKLIHRLNGERRVVNHSEAVLIQPGDYHSMRLENSSSDRSEYETHFINLAFRPSFFTASLDVYFSPSIALEKKISMFHEGLNKNREKILFNDDKLLNEELKRLEQAWTNNQTQTLNAYASAFLSLFLAQYALNEGQAKRSDLPPWLSGALSVYQQEENIGQDFEHFYHLCGKSKEHISRSLKEHFGKPASVCLHELKVERAKKMLTDAGVQVTDVAIRLGYEHVSYFIYIFKQQTGKSPAQFRREQGAILPR